jgi:hypothetical protein
LLAGWRYAHEKCMMLSFTVRVVRVAPTPRTTQARHPSPPMQLQFARNMATILPARTRIALSLQHNCNAAPSSSRRPSHTPATKPGVDKGYVDLAAIQARQAGRKLLQTWRGWGRKPARWRPAAHSSRSTHACRSARIRGWSSLSWSTTLYTRLSILGLPLSTYAGRFTRAASMLSSINTLYRLPACISQQRTTGYHDWVVNFSISPQCGSRASFLAS